MLFALVVALLFSTRLASADPGNRPTRTYVYAPDFTSVMANPGRGYFENFSGFDHFNPQFFDDEYAGWLTDPAYDEWRFGGGYLDLLRSWREDGVTVLDAGVYLNDYIDTPELPQSFLSELARSLQVVREARMKIVLRLQYADDWTPLVVERNYLRHIEQIAEVVTANADIVEGMCAGVLGPWGEWHTDDSYVMVDNLSYRRGDRPEYNGHGPTTDLDSPEQGAQRYRLVQRWLDLTPDTVPILIRYAENLMEIMALAQRPPSGSTGLTQAQLDRLGLHDDSFASYVMADTRRGGWDEKFYPYWDGHREYDQATEVAAFSTQLVTSYGGDVLQDGEAAWYPDDGLGLDDPLMDTATLDAGARLALSEAAARRMSLMNRSFNLRHLDLWQNTMLPASGDDPAESAYSRLDRKLGYRLRLDRAEFTSVVRSGDQFSFRAVIHNDGYAGPIRSRPVFLVFDDGVNRYDIELTEVDARTWRSGEHMVDVTVTLPADLAAGEYAVALWLPDHYENLRGLPEYSVRFANQDVWRGGEGYNYLGPLECRGAARSAVTPLPWLAWAAVVALATGGLSLAASQRRREA
ncbi:MAG: DUF4832 domain-containing protein [Propionibacteriaceae bacterium]|nr:DUF4832 domain-containing protein [Propionibacteriaceae bacterium]